MRVRQDRGKHESLVHSDRKPAIDPDDHEYCMSDLSEIKKLIYTYAKRVDAGDFEGVATLLADARIVTRDGSVLAQGFDSILELYRSTVKLHEPSGTPLTQHVVSNVILNIDDCEAHGFCQYTVFQATETIPLQAIICGSYEDRFTRDRGRWQWRERCMRANLYGDVSQHLKRFRKRESNGTT